MCAFAPCYSMEEEVTKAILITTLITKAPQSVICLKDNNVAVLGKYDLSLYNFFTNEKIIELQDYSNSETTLYQHISVDQKKEKLALHRQDILAVYDLKTKGKMWSMIEKSNSWQGAPAFNPINTTFFVGDILFGINSYNYKKDSSKTYNPFNRNDTISCATQLGFHPTKQEMLFLTDTHVDLAILQFDKQPLIKQIISTGCTDAKDSIKAAKFSPDGSLIAINNQQRGCSIYDLISSTNSFIPDEYQIIAMEFHPTKTVIAIIPAIDEYLEEGDAKGAYIHYWNAKTQKYIIGTTFSNTGIYFYHSHTLIPPCEPISFSDDGTKIVIALEEKDQCLIIDVPQEVLEQASWSEQ